MIRKKIKLGIYTPGPVMMNISLTGKNRFAWIVLWFGHQIFPGECSTVFLPFVKKVTTMLSDAP